jgi:hypothetical protein
VFCGPLSPTRFPLVVAVRGFAVDYQIIWSWWVCSIGSRDVPGKELMSTTILLGCVVLWERVYIGVVRGSVFYYSDGHTLIRENIGLCTSVNVSFICRFVCLDRISGEVPVCWVAGPSSLCVIGPLFLRLYCMNVLWQICVKHILKFVCLFLRPWYALTLTFTAAGLRTLAFRTVWIIRIWNSAI